MRDCKNQNLTQHAGDKMNGTPKLAYTSKMIFHSRVDYLKKFVHKHFWSDIYETKILYKTYVDLLNREIWRSWKNS